MKISSLFRSQPKTVNLNLGPGEIDWREHRAETINRFFDADNVAAFEWFLIFCCQQFVVENLVAYIAILSFEKFPTEAKASYIYSRFLSRQSAYEINVPTLSLTIQQGMNRTTSRYSGTRGSSRIIATPSNHFATIKNAVLCNIMDPYDRLLLKGSMVGNTVQFQPHEANSSVDTRVSDIKRMFLEMRDFGFVLPFVVREFSSS